MNPNSTHQLWSKWMWLVRPGRKTVLPFEPVKAAIARFTKAHFGSAGQMRITERLDCYYIELLIEGKPAHDPEYIVHTAFVFENFFSAHFGAGTRTTLSGPRLMSGSRQDGTPPDQLIILPSLRWDGLSKG